MSTDATTPNQKDTATVQPIEEKGKGKAKAPAEDVSMEEEEDDDEEESGDENEASSDEDEEEEDYEEIDPNAILGGGRRTRGVKVDYTSQEALQKAGLDKDEDKDDEDEDVVMKE